MNTPTQFHPTARLAVQGTWRKASTAMPAAGGGLALAQKVPVHPQLLIPCRYSPGPSQKSKQRAPAQEASRVQPWLCGGPKLTSAAVSSPLGHARHQAGSCCQTCQKRKLERLGRGHCTAPALVMSKASKHPDSTKGRLSPGYLSAEAEGTLLIPTVCSTRGWSPTHTGRLVAEAHTGQQSP